MSVVVSVTVNEWFTAAPNNTLADDSSGACVSEVAAPACARVGSMDGTYTGQHHANGQREGQGRLEYANGSVYEGEWEADEFHGRGRYASANGDGYEGEFRAGVMHGEGQYWFVNGDEYKGHYKNGLHEGHGVYTDASGDKYEGEWKMGVREGRGIKTFADGEFMISRFAGDVPVGDAAVWSADRKEAWLIKDGNLADVKEISLEEADRVAERLDKAR